MLRPELIEFSQDNQKAELRIVPSLHGPITEDDLRQLLALPDFSCLGPLQAAITQAVIQVNQLHPKDEGKIELFFEIGERRDAEISFDVSSDKMQASMILTAAFGGKDLGLRDVLRNLKLQRISMGLSKAKIDALLTEFATLLPGIKCHGIIANGRAAVNGTSAKLDRKVSLARERLLQPQQNSDGTVDMRNLGAVIMVKPGNLLIVKHPATQGVDGYNVYGEKLNAKPGKDIKFTAGNGTEFSPDDPNQLIATVAGQPVETPSGMQVDDVLQIKNVDVGFGHVDFKGSVLITGDVGEGMVVKSQGDITVMGFVDSATLEAKGDITVSKGIIGRQLKDLSLSTKLTAQGQISAQFVQYSQLNALGNILVTKQLLHSHTKTEQQLIVSDASGRRGDLVGGKAEANKGIKAVALGATADTKTEVFCAMELTDLKEQLKQLDQSIKSMVVAGLNIEAQLRKLPPKTQWQGDAMMVEQVTVMLDEKRRISAIRAQEELEYDTLKMEVDNYYKHYYIDARKHVFSNVELHIGTAFQRTQREHGPCRIRNQNKEINFDYSH
ncbi:protein of unknown function DUF342 [Shewanella halifaxensis HAW-EB4]|uniref:Flagellar Assembly Protein A N-terminal region domain-containing protein n=1 Tax=Shewanella halifaxensis (strain HAW-EB4) TaxID=458817 RepID=B0TSU7_SHEHH|nr:FapA family protein [Shewanella halifaxensis]ABZ75272.1 protein of unknown function DUF342 [Shewanella halifaxensis HAW-EB4]